MNREGGAPMKRTGEKKQIVYALLTGFLGFFVYEFLYYFGIAQLTISSLT